MSQRGKSGDFTSVGSKLGMKINLPNKQQPIFKVTSHLNDANHVSCQAESEMLSTYTPTPTLSARPMT